MSLKITCWKTPSISYTAIRFNPLPRVSIALTPEKLRAIFGEDLRVSPAKDAL